MTYVLLGAWIVALVIVVGLASFYLDPVTLFGDDLPWPAEKPDESKKS